MLGLADLRRRRGLTQIELAHRARVSSRTIAAWEAGLVTPHQRNLRALARALGLNVEDLTKAAENSSGLMPESDPDLGPVGRDEISSLLAEGIRATDFDQTRDVSEAEVMDFADYLRRVLPELDRMDWQFGWRLALPLAAVHMADILRFMITAKGRARRELVAQGARYAEFMAWLYQDRGEYESAEKWAGRAFDWAYECDDVPMVSYVLARKSSLAAAKGVPMEAISFAQTAYRQSESLPPRIRATALYQQAVGEALLGDQASCEQHLKDAMNLTETTGPASTDPPARHQTPEYLEIQLALCHLRLGKTVEAIDVLERYVKTEGFRKEHRRDRGVYLAELANAYATIADPTIADLEHATRWGREALEIYEITGSDRIIGALDKLQRRLAELPGSTDITELETRLESAREIG